MNNFDLKKFLVENKLTTNSKALSVNEAAEIKDGEYMIDGKQVDFDSIQPAQEDFGNGLEWYIDHATFTDGTELTPDQLDELADLYYPKGRGVSQSDRTNF
jgi:hypothetical protein